MASPISCCVRSSTNRQVQDPLVPRLQATHEWGEGDPGLGGGLSAVLLAQQSAIVAVPSPSTLAAERAVEGGRDKATVSRHGLDDLGDFEP